RQKLRNAGGQQGVRRRKRPAAHQNQVRAEIERRVLTRQAHGGVECRSVRHDGGSRENTVLVSFDNSLVHIAGEAEVIGIHHQLFLVVQKMASLMRRNFLGFARISLRSWCSSPVAPFRVSYNCGFTASCPSVPCLEFRRSTVLSTFATIALILL